MSGRMQSAHNHLTIDDLDAVHLGEASAVALSHIATCSQCQALVEADRLLMAELAALPLYSPAPALSDRVLAAIRAKVPAGASVATPRALAARRRVRAAGGTIGAAIAAGTVWAVVQPGGAALWAGRFRDVAGAVWAQWQSVVHGVTQLPWYSTAQQMGSQPSRAALLVCGIAAVYAGGIAAMRRLMAEPRTDASW